MPLHSKFPSRTIFMVLSLSEGVLLQKSCKMLVCCSTDTHHR